MKPIALAIAALFYLAGGAAMFFINRTFSPGNPEMSFIVGAILGTQAGVYMHHRQPNAEPTTGAKAILGLVMAVCAVALGVSLHQTMKPFKFVEVSLPFAAVGSFFFPFVLFNMMWKTLSKERSKP